MVGEREMIEDRKKHQEEMKEVEVEDELSERCTEGSGIFLTWADSIRPMMNSVLEGLRRRKLDDIH